LAAVHVHGAPFSSSSPISSPPSGSSFGIPGSDATYDYVIVGGGNAGLTLGSRLVEQKAGSVAIIEAGTFYELTGNISQVPATAAVWAGKSPLDSNPLADWGYVTTSQPVRRTCLYSTAIRA
jgi:choline dehydrogenase